MNTAGRVLSVSRSQKHTFSKRADMFIRLQAGLGVEGDAHMGETVKHRSRVVKDPGAPNLRQVHLIHAELFDALKDQGFTITPGDMGENITTEGVDLLALPERTRLRLGSAAIVEITGLRNPCNQLNRFKPGLMQAVLDKDDDGDLIRKSGIMAIVISGGQVDPGDPITVHMPEEPHQKLKPV